MLLMFFGYVIEFKKLSEVSLKCRLPYPKSNKPFPFNFLAIGEFARKNYGEALMYINDALKLMPFHPTYSVTKARFQEQLGDREGAKKTLFLSLDYEEHTSVLQHIGRMLIDEGNSKDALKYLEKANLDSIMLETGITYELARAYRLTGQIEKAQEFEFKYNTETKMLKEILSGVSNARLDHLMDAD